MRAGGGKVLHHVIVPGLLTQGPKGSGGAPILSIIDLTTLCFNQNFPSVQLGDFNWDQSCRILQIISFLRAEVGLLC